MSEEERDTQHLPAPSLWPIGFAIGVACILVGLVVSVPALIVGAVIALSSASSGCETCSPSTR